jgi:hypothetical protein
MPSTLTKKQQQAVALLVDGQRPEKVREMLGLRKYTMLRWLKDADFIAQYELLLGEMRFSFRHNIEIMRRNASMNMACELGDYKTNPRLLETLMNILENLPNLSEIYAKELQLPPKLSRNTPKTTRKSVQLSLLAGD